jgi:WD40 repeat protein
MQKKRRLLGVMLALKASLVSPKFSVRASKLFRQTLSQASIFGFRSGHAMGDYPRSRVAAAMALAVTVGAAPSYAQKRSLEAPFVARGYVTISADGMMLASGGSSHPEIRLWELKSGKLLRTIRAHPTGIARLAFSPDGKMLASGGWYGDPKVRIWDCSTGKLVRELGSSQSAVCFVAFAPDGKSLISCVDMGVTFWDLKSGRAKWTAKASAPIDSIAISPGGQLLASANGDQTVGLWELRSGKLVDSLAAKQTIATGSQGVAFSPDGKVLATGGGPRQQSAPVECRD